MFELPFQEKITNMLKINLLFAGAMLVACLAFGQEGQKAPLNTESLSLSDAIKNHGFPEVKGTSAKEKMEYRASKKEWVAKNPELYKKLNKAPQPLVQPALIDEKTFKKSIENQSEAK